MTTAEAELYRTKLNKVRSRLNVNNIISLYCILAEIFKQYLLVQKFKIGQSKKQKNNFEEDLKLTQLKFQIFRTSLYSILLFNNYFKIFKYPVKQVPIIFRIQNIKTYNLIDETKLLKDLDISINSDPFLILMLEDELHESAYNLKGTHLTNSFLYSNDNKKQSFNQNIDKISNFINELVNNTNKRMLYIKKLSKKGISTINIHFTQIDLNFFKECYPMHVHNTVQAVHNSAKRLLLLILDNMCNKKFYGRYNIEESIKILQKGIDILNILKNSKNIQIDNIILQKKTIANKQTVLFIEIDGVCFNNKKKFKLKVDTPNYSYLQKQIPFVLL